MGEGGAVFWRTTGEAVNPILLPTILLLLLLFLFVLSPAPPQEVVEEGNRVEDRCAPLCSNAAAENGDKDGGGRGGEEERLWEFCQWHGGVEGGSTLIAPKWWA